MQPQMQSESQPKLEDQPEGATREVEPARWRLATRIAFRFAVVYFPLYTLWIPIHFISIRPVPQLFEKYHLIWQAMVPWVGKHLLHLHREVEMFPISTGSWDTIFNDIQVLCYLMVAAALTLIWSLLDRKRPNYEHLYPWFRLYLRLALAAVMIPYGAAKVFPLQFKPATLFTLLEPYGDSSPMHLLWTFMGASPIYSFFGGLAEIVGGILLVVPRLTTLGALICIGVVSNVFMLNLGYDVPVKVFSLHLIVIATLLVIPDLKRLADFFVFNRRVDPAPPRPLFRRTWLNRVVLILQVTFGIVLLGHDLHYSQREAARLLESRLQAPLYGIWAVDEFTLDGQVRPPLLTDAVRWQRIIVEDGESGVVQLMNGLPRRLDVHVDPGTKSLSMTLPNSMAWRADFSYEQPQPDLLTLKGQADGRPVTATLHRVDETRFLLNRRGFHWITEYPVDR